VKGGAEMRQIRYTEAINEALMEEMSRDETVYIIGECATAEPMGAHKGLVEKFGKDRVKDAALSEPAIIGSCVGAALGGYRPIANMRFSDFIIPALDEVIHKAAKWRFGHGGKQKIPLVIIAAIGGYIGAGPEHSQCLESIIMHTPGLKLAIPTTPYDAKGLLKTAIRDNNPVVYFFHKLFIGTKGEVPEEEYTIPFGVADIKRQGKDVTVVATGYMVQMALGVANQLQERGIDIEVIDPRTLEPLDIDTIVASVKKTKRVVIVDEDTLQCGVTGEIGMQIVERAFDYLDAPIQRVGSANLPIPGGFFERYVLPQPQDIADATGKVLGLKERLSVMAPERQTFHASEKLHLEQK
jgi:pyruvate/2-oxoglutarate/acetoin dehydrogenase E1 component